jgi:hypothetical protein
LVTRSADGKLTIVPGFLGSEEDAQAIAEAFNARELERYKAESFASVLQPTETPSLRELAEKLGIGFTEE